ncbi:MAG: M20/M25/M40 family metallo-hydrolase, partial [Sporosarcina sp.]
MFQAGGESANIIPGNAVFSLDLRSQTNAVMDKLLERVEKAIHSVADLSEVTINTTVTSETVAAEVDETAVEIMASAITETVGEQYLAPPIVTPGGEDFHYYTLKRNSVKATMLGLGCDLSPGLHHPKMTFNQDSILTGIEILVRAVIKTIEKLESGD